jgi:hypothetical protein
MNNHVIGQPPTVSLHLKRSTRDSLSRHHISHTSAPSFMITPRPLGASDTAYIERIIICLHEQVRYPLPASPSAETSTWDESYRNFHYHKSNLEAGNIAPVDDIEAFCLNQTWHANLWRVGVAHPSTLTHKERTLRAIDNALSGDQSLGTAHYIDSFLYALFANFFVPARRALPHSLPSTFRLLPRLPSWTSLSVTGPVGLDDAGQSREHEHGSAPLAAEEDSSLKSLSSVLDDLYPYTGTPPETLVLLYRASPHHSPAMKTRLSLSFSITILS